MEGVTAIPRNLLEASNSTMPPKHPWRTPGPEGWAAYAFSCARGESGGATTDEHMAGGVARIVLRRGLALGVRSVAHDTTRRVSSAQINPTKHLKPHFLYYPIFDQDKTSCKNA